RATSISGKSNAIRWRPTRGAKASTFARPSGFCRPISRTTPTETVAARDVPNLRNLRPALGNRPTPFLDVKHVLAAFGQTRGAARPTYGAFVVEGLDEKPMRERTRRGDVWRTIASLAERSRRQGAQEHILGSAAFLDQIRGEAAPPPTASLRNNPPPLDVL